MGNDRPNGASDLDFLQPGELPFLSSCPIFGRRIINVPFHDGVRFHMFLPQDDGSLMIVQPVDMRSGHYLGRGPARQDDVPNVLENVIVQCYSYPTFIELGRDMTSDMLNAFASLHRYFILLRYANDTPDPAHRQLIISELEYAFANHRAFFDLVAKIIRLFRADLQVSGAVLPDSFRRILQKTNDDLIRKFGMPEAFVQFIRRRERSFFALRAIRDGIYHRGETITDVIFTLPDGFGISAGAELRKKLEAFDLWRPEQLVNGAIASLLPILELLARDLWETASELATLMWALTGRPAPIAEQYHLYLRSPLVFHLGMLSRYRESHWISSDAVLPSRGGAA